MKTKFCKKAVQKALCWQFIQEVLDFSPVVPDTSYFLWNEQLTMILISANWEAVLNTTVIKSVLNLENHAIYTHVRSATIDYFHHLFSLSLFFFLFFFFIFRNIALSIVELLRTRTDALKSDRERLPKDVTNKWFYLHKASALLYFKSFILTRSS